MPKNVVLWNFAVRNTVYEKMVELSPCFMKKWAQGDHRGRLVHNQFLVNLFQEAQLALGLKLEERRAAPSGQNELVKIEAAVREYFVAATAVKEVSPLPKAKKAVVPRLFAGIAPVSMTPVKAKDAKAWATVSGSDWQPGYHAKPIIKGELGELSKVREELDEAIDAEEQGVKLMVLVELSDVVGAIEHYLDKHFPDLTFPDLHKMAAVTRRAFKNGRRT